jgi:hypothetical protein
VKPSAQTTGPAMTNTNPLIKPETAYLDLPETEYKAEMDVAARYQAFTGELLRLALLGIAVFGFLYKEVFLAFDPVKHPNVPIDAATSLARWGLLSFGICTLLALTFSYSSAEGTRLFLEGLRFHIAKDEAAAKLKLHKREVAMVICMVSKAGAALALASGSMLTAFAFFRLLA